MPTTRFRSRDVAFASKLRVEENLIRLILAGCGSLPDILVYLCRFCLHVSYTAIVREWFDLPLRAVLGRIEEQLADHEELSPSSAAAYLGPFRLQLEKFCAQHCCGPAGGSAAGRAAQADAAPALQVAETILRDYFPNGVADVRCAVARVATCLRALPFSWGAPEVMEIFWNARHGDICNYILARVWFNREAAKDLCHETWLVVQKKLPEYKPKRAPFIAFTFHKATNVVWTYRRRRQRAPLHVPLDQVEEHHAALAHFQIEFELPELDAAFVKAIHLQLFGLLFAIERLPNEVLLFIRCFLLDVKPGKIVADLWDKPLRSVARLIEKEFLQATDLPPEQVQRCFEKLHQAMDLPLSAVLSGDKTRGAFAAWLSVPVGDLRLGTYFRDKAGAAGAQKISENWQSVLETLALQARRKLKPVLQELQPDFGAADARRPKARLKTRKAARKKSSSPRGQSATCPQWVKSSKPRNNSRREQGTPNT